MTTAAENSGRLDSYMQAQEMGVVMQKTWLATDDSRTRKSHREVDGETIPLNEEFSNQLMYPGDPMGAPEEVYNCRCTLTADVDAEQTAVSKSNLLADAAIAAMSYEEWEEMMDE